MTPQNPDNSDAGSMSLAGAARAASEGFEALATGLAREVGELQALCLLAGAHEARPAALERVSAAVDALEARLARLEDDVGAELALAADARALAADLAAQTARAEDLRRAYKPLQTAADGDRDDDDDDNDRGNGDDAREAREARGPEHEAEDEDEDEAPEGDAECAGATVDEDTGEVRVTAPSEEQLAAVPKYMRGRLTVGKVEAAVAVVNAAFAYKRATLAIPRGKQSVSVRDQVMQWRDQELDETEGLHFVTRDDVFAQAARDGVDLNVIKSALQVLRHSGALRLISGGGCARYCV